MNPFRKKYLGLISFPFWMPSESTNSPFFMTFEAFQNDDVREFIHRFPTLLKEGKFYQNHVEGKIFLFIYY